MAYDKTSFALGMVTAFCECVAGGCKRLALSPPLAPEECDAIEDAAKEIINRHGLVHARERNPELPEGERWEWILIARRREVLEEYRRRRAEGLSPARSLAPFYDLLSYNEAESVHTGYDAWKSLF